ncbi:hypothetical protein PN471_20690 [Aphanizomenon sp. CS-733/32]|uniref:hypothetical protein n=1 Tax=Aphanizomenon sp. CS-733/32 TaxID=3021715 RepID=UPI00233153BE|nr:hypothetical protein [Aphanizomenon sp. CS-733/32]MDB9310998.1 hypothetical protein [Aphanizomenon sp. CS-733/32]
MLSGSADGGDDEFFDVLFSFSSNSCIHCFISSIRALTIAVLGCVGAIAVLEM